MMGLPDSPKSFRICLVVLIQYRLWQTASHPASHIPVAITLNAKASSLKLRLYSCHFNPLFATNHESIRVLEITSIYLSTRVNNLKTATNWKIPIFRCCCHMNWGLWTTGGAFKCLLTLYFAFSFPKFVPVFSANITDFRLRYPGQP